MHDSIQAKGDKLKGHLPSFVNDHTGSIISAAHLIGEMSMLKSNGLVVWENKRVPGEAVHPVIDPSRNLFRALTGAEKGGINNWGTRSTMIGTLGWTLGTILPDAPPDTAFDAQEKEKLEGKSFLQKSGIHLKEALSITNPHYKRQMVGLTTSLSGICSMMSGIYSVTKEGAPYVNKWRTAGGVITTLAGSQLMLTDDPKAGWTRYAMTKWARIPVAGKSIHRMYQEGDTGWRYYLGGQMGLQGGGLLSILLGGDALDAVGTSSNGNVPATWVAGQTPRNRIESEDAAHIAPTPLQKMVTA